MNATLAGRDVRRIGFGAMQLAGPGVFGPPADPANSIAVLRRAVELGVNHIDTAEFYGPHIVNQLIAEALHPYADDLVLVSKIGARRDDAGNWVPFQHPQHLIQDARENLATLKVESLPVINLRVMPKHELPSADDYCPLEQQLETMRGLVDDGTIDAFGVSNVTTDEARTALDAGAVCVQNPYNLLMRDDDATVDLCAERNAAYVPFFPLGSGFPNMPKVTADPRVEAVAQRRGVSTAEVGLAWLLHRSPSILLIPGTSSVEHLEQNLRAGELELTDADVAELEG